MQQTVVALICDVTGDPADETVTYALDGKMYEMDVTAVKAKEFRDLLAPWTEVSRRVTGRGSRAGASTTVSRDEARRVRAWARERGLSVTDRGRVPAALVARYRAEVGT